jgi:xylose isomerase
MPGRYDQDLRFGSANLKSTFWLVKFLEDVGYAGPRHFDAHAYRTEDYDGVKDFARGCMRTYLILKERAARWNADPENSGAASEHPSNRPGRAAVIGIFFTTPRHLAGREVRSHCARGEGIGV